MLYVKKSGTTEYGNWAYGSLKYKGFEVQDIFAVSDVVSADHEYEIKRVELKRTKNGQMRFKLFL